MKDIVLPKLNQASNLNKNIIFNQLMISQNAQQITRLFSVDPQEFINCLLDLLKFQVVQELKFIQNKTDIHKAIDKINSNR